MHILFVIPVEYKDRELGGVATYTFNIAQALKSIGHKVEVLCPGKVDGKTKVKGLIFHKVLPIDLKIKGKRFLQKVLPVFLARISWGLSVYKFVTKYRKYDIVESPEWGAGNLVLAFRGYKNTIVRLHKSQIQYYGENLLPIGIDIILVNLLEVLSVIFASGVTSPTKYMVSTHWFAKKIRTFCRSYMKIIPNGVPIPLLRKYNFHPKKDYILTVGRLEDGKGTLTLVRAFCKLAPLYPNLRLYLVGRDTKKYSNTKWISYKSILLKEIEKFKDRSKIRFFGQVPQDKLGGFYQNCFFYVAPSSGYENHPLSLLDAISYKKAVIVSSAGGLAEIVRHGKNGLVFKENDINDLLMKMKMLSQDKALRVRFQKSNALERTRYDIKKTSLLTSSFYKVVSQ